MLLGVDKVGVDKTTEEEPGAKGVGEMVFAGRRRDGWKHETVVYEPTHQVAEGMAETVAWFTQRLAKK